MDNNSVYHEAFHINLQSSMKILKSISLYTQIHQFRDNQSKKLLRFTIFSWIPKNS